MPPPTTHHPALFGILKPPRFGSFESSSMQRRSSSRGRWTLENFKLGPVTRYKWSYGASISRVVTPVTFIYRAYIAPFITSRGPPCTGYAGRGPVVTTMASSPAAAEGITIRAGDQIGVWLGSE